VTSKTERSVRNSGCVAAVVVLALLIGARVPASFAATNQVGPIVADIASLPFANGNSCQGVITAVQGGGLVESDLNKALGTDFQPFAVSSPECAVLVSFIPVIGTYNNLIEAAIAYDPNNPQTVTNFYEQAFLLAAEVSIVGFALDGTLYEASYDAVGQLNDGLKLGKLRSVCGNECYSDVLSALYWFIKDTASGALDGFLSWASSYLPVQDLPPLPWACSVPIFGALLSALGVIHCYR
jgi:hypothetical protein